MMCRGWAKWRKDTVDYITEKISKVCFWNIFFYFWPHVEIMKPKSYLRNRPMIKPKNNFVVDLKWTRNWAKRKALLQFQISEKLGNFIQKEFRKLCWMKMMFCICSNVKASISLTQRWRRNGLKSNGSAHCQGYCSFEMGLFEDARSNFISLNSEITEGFPM